MWPDIRRSGTPKRAPHHHYAREVPAPGPAPSRRRWSGLYSGEPETCQRDYRHFLPVLAHLTLLFGVFRVFRVEGPGFQSLVLIALGALPIHYLAPYRWKKPLFLATSGVGLFWIFGLEISSYVVAFAAILIGACRLPVSWIIRAGAVAGLAAVFAALRPGALGSIIPETVWPVLATLFMFRMVIYLYELKHAKTPEPLIDALNYFFLLPNFCFTHFPVVDYRTFQRSFFAEDVHATQRAGLRMMFKGATHLLLYRVLYHEALIRPEDVHGPLALSGFLVCNYLMYLHVSGQFHVACGMIHLFGYALPETHRHYLLAESFTDYWRRINIYWKDFMVRVVFNPVVFRLKRWPRPRALALATAVVFVTTWLLHGYQMFWISGSWGFSAQDGLFWGILGLLVMVNVQLDARRTRTRKARIERDDPRGWLIRAAKTAATFVTIALLWSLWTSPGLDAWVDMLRRGVMG